ncbi:NAD(P)/FAD-dependent oxidoreductase [Desulfovibrio oxyclinae]|jgi:thioredoxin reductase (NADPH)|uniref:NAD(P)/FAD-dependent oxidoreductase n=1 Tax=Desulfovibrio oxyclinae TaxID=63560 RepID=UPI000377AE36|nr:FAD-dependent oxidoreductase [Desulfovibrio oxyclinae]
MSELARQYDVVILGSGPGGIQAAIHASRKKASTLLLGRIADSSLFWAHVENYCCMFKVSGEEILRTGREQAQAFGAEFFDEDVLKVEKNGDLIVMETESGEIIEAKSLIIATGTTRNKLGVPGEKELLGKGVSYCADCDAGFFKNEVVVVAGCRSAAAGGAVTLSHHASETHLICNELDVSDKLRLRLVDAGVIMHEGRSIEKIEGEHAVTGVTLDDGEKLDCAGVFIELGAKGVLELAASLGLTMDESMRYVDVDRKQRTNVKGIFAAGDITGPPLQMAKAVGEGCVAGVSAAAHAKQFK